MLRGQQEAAVVRERVFASGGIYQDPSVPGQLVYVTPLKRYICVFEGTHESIRVLLQRREPSSRLNSFSAALFECQVKTCKAPLRAQFCLVVAVDGTVLRRWSYCDGCGGVLRSELEMMKFIEQDGHGIEV